MYMNSAYKYIRKSNLIFWGRLFLVLPLFFSFVRCDIDPGIIDWRLAPEVHLDSFPEDLAGKYISRYSSRFLSGKVDCGKDQLIFRKNFLSLVCGQYALAYCVPSSITRQGKNYKVLCDRSVSWQYPPNLKLMDAKIGKPEGFSINHVSRGRIAIVHDMSDSFNRIYEKKEVN